MKIVLLQVGSTVDNYLKTGVSEYTGRLKHYVSFETQEIKDVRNAGKLSREELKRKEASEILKKIHPGDFIVLLDEQGRKLSSEKFAEFIQKRMNQSTRKLIFIIGGAFGFDKAVYDRADYMLSLSDMTFSHRMIRLLFTEQLYRAHTILRGEPYHH